MRQFRVPLLLALILACFGSIFAQSSPARVCVAEIDTREPSVSPTATRDALIKFLGKQKGLQAEEVPLDTSDAAGAMTQAKDKQCDYLIKTTVSEVHSESGYTTTQAGGISTQSGVNMLTFFVTTNYRMYEVSDASEQASGSFKASDRGSAQSAVIATTKKIAERVAGSIKSGTGK
jgi:hypothetical protein